MYSTLTFGLLAIAGGFAGYALIDSKGKGLINWAVLLIAVALLIPRF